MAGKHVQKKTTARSAEPEPRYERTRSAVTPERRAVSRGTVVIEPEAPRYERDRRRERDDDRPRLRWAIPVIAALVVLVGILAGVTVYGSRIAKIDTIYPNVSAAGVDLGGMTVDEAVAALEASDAMPDTNASVTVHLPLDSTFTVTSAELGVSADARPVAEQAYMVGRGGSMLDTMRAYRACKKTPTELPWDIQATVDETKLHGIVEAAVGEVNAKLLGSDAEIGDDGVTLVKGMNAAAIDPNEVFDKVLSAFKTGVYDDIKVEFGTPEATPGQDEYAVLEAVYTSIFVEPKDAEYNKDTGEVTESVRGVSFDMDEAKRLWDAAKPGDEVFIPFVFTEPAIDSEKLSKGLFADLLSEKSTSLSGSSSNRINNITLTAQAVNDVVLEPGETFDYNSVVGQRTTARGYKEAGAYSGGRHVNEVGGGICQTSSTIYFCAMYANLRITTRSCHMFAVSYLPRGYDATVSWGGPDFRFVNSREYPIKIKAWVSNGSLTVQIWGTDDGTRVEMTSDTWEDSTYYYAQTYRTVYAADGTQISHAKEAYSSYRKYEDTGETPIPDTNTTPEPDPTAAPTPDATAAPAPTNAPAPTDPPPAQTSEPTPVPPPEETAPPEPTAAPQPDPTAAPQPDPLPEPEPGGEEGGE